MGKADHAAHASAAAEACAAAIADYLTTGAPPTALRQLRQHLGG